jgi:serine/threonine protein phosphatase PrpC
MYKSFAVTVTGSSHIKHGKGCEDASTQYNDSKVSIAVVADGHGDYTCFRSAQGAKFAAACAENSIRDFVRKKEFSGDQAEKCLRELLIRGILSSWDIMVSDHYAASPITAEEIKNAGEEYYAQFSKGQNIHHAYGSTLIAAAITEDYWVGIHIGDGRLTAIYPDGSFEQPVPWDERCFRNETTSICDDDALEGARCYFSFHGEKEPPVAVFLCTDGVDDNYPADENEFHLYRLYYAIALTFAKDGFDSACMQINDLAASFAANGKGDDTSIAGFIDMEALKKAVALWKEQGV